METENIFDNVTIESTEGKLLVDLDTFLEKVKKEFELDQGNQVLLEGQLIQSILEKEQYEKHILDLYKYFVDVKKETIDKIVEKSKIFLSPLIPKSGGEKEILVEKNNTLKKPENISPLQALSSIKERMTQASTIAPTKRDYSIQKPELLEALTETKKQMIDHYREKPE